MASASGIYEKEELRRSAILPHLSAALSIGMTKIVNLDLTSPDGAVIVTLTGDIPETATIMLDEQKREIGEGGSDPSIQVGLSMIRCWVQDNVCVLRGLFARYSCIVHSTASSETTPAAPPFFSPVLAHGLPC